MIKNLQIWGHSLSMKRVSILLIATLLLASLLTVTFLSSQQTTSAETDSVYVGVSFCGNTTQEAILLIDKVKTYTNLFVLQSGPISTNETATTEICDYAASQGLNLIVYFGWFNPDYPWQFLWVENAPQRYGDQFLGVYYYDEPGGIQIDYDWENHFINLSNRLKAFGANITWYQQYFLDQFNGYLNGSIVDYDVEAQTYINYLQNDHDLSLLKNSSTPTFVSDYALYWWDYLGGYDVVLTQLGNNASIIQEIDLTKGAANLQGKDWGTIITWKYDEAPYLDSGEEIYNQMVLSYQAGAKYIIIFDYPTIDGNPYGVLTDDHFEAMQQFWQDITTQSIQKIQAEAVLVLPHNYGWGMRNVADRIWLWGPDEYCQQIWDISQTLIEQYGIKLDIVYDDSQFSIDGKYQQVYYWNQTLT
jgi:hypothetical protein